jgi:nuclear factor related to kappa-B-binding protein
LLKLDRPSCVTILTLVRDSAARLPSGVGTRADICELLKESQYINDSISEERLSTIVSGALDRLHYNADSCVKYDSERKLWLFVQSELEEGVDG